MKRQGSCNFCGKLNPNKKKVGWRYHCSDECRIKDLEAKKKERIAFYEERKQG